MDGNGTAAPPANLADTAWEEPPRRRAIGDAPVLSVDGIQEPLDWWVEQARAGGIDLARLSIVALVDEFARALATMLAQAECSPATLARWGTWLVMAADLALLRSRLLLPADTVEADTARDEAATLRQRVQVRAEMAAAADWLEGRLQLGRDVWARGQGEGTVKRGGRSGDIVGLMRACLAALRVTDGVEATFRVSIPLWSVADAMGRIRAILPTTEQGRAPLEHFLPAIPPGSPGHDLRCRAAVASTFSAGLETTREGVVTLEQAAAFSSIGVIAMVTRDGPPNPQ